MKTIIALILCIALIRAASGVQPNSDGENVRPAVKACQQYQNRPTDRILGGESAHDKEFPWMAALGYTTRRNPSNIRFNCGGILISDRFVITSAHCIRSSNMPTLVRLGRNNLIDNENGSLSSNYEIKKVYRHPLFSIFSKTNDIGLIELSKSVWLNDNTMPACLHTDLADLDADKKLIITGWGSTTHTKITRINELQKAQLKTVPLLECNKTISDFYKRLEDEPAFELYVHDGQYCAYDPVVKSCSGDDGGPLQIFPDSSALAHIVGITSFSFGCEMEIPTIFTRVAYYLDWIESIVWPETQ